MRIALCDDDSRQITILESYIQKWATRHRVPVTVAPFSSVENFLFHWTSPQMFDVAFLDIRMGDITGMELAVAIRERESDMAIVFVTADRDFVFQGYEVDALHYLVKPVNEADCHRCLDRVQERMITAESTTLLVGIDGVLTRIKHDDIMYLESMKHYVDIHTIKDVIRYRKKFSELVEELAEFKNFVQVHRSYMVNLRFVSAMEDGLLILEDGGHIPISRNRWRDVHIAFVKYHASM